MPHATNNKPINSQIMTDEDLEIPDAPPVESYEAINDGSAILTPDKVGEGRLHSAPKQDVKLEDLFNDDDDEEEEEEDNRGESDGNPVDSTAPTLDVSTSPPAGQKCVDHRCPKYKRGMTIV